MAAEYMLTPIETHSNAQEVEAEEASLLKKGAERRSSTRAVLVMTILFIGIVAAVMATMSSRNRGLPRLGATSSSHFIVELFGLSPEYIDEQFHVSVKEEVGDLFGGDAAEVRKVEFGNEDLATIWAEYTGDSKEFMSKLLNRMQERTGARYVIICKGDTVVHAFEIVEKLIITTTMSSGALVGVFDAFAFNGNGTMDRDGKPAGWTNWAWLSPYGSTSRRGNLVTFK